MAARFKRNGLLIIFLSGVMAGFSQQEIRGVVKDATTKEPVSSASVTIKNGRGILTDSTGYFSLMAEKFPLQLMVSIIGYKVQTIPLKDFKDSANGKRDTLVIYIQASSSMLSAVTVKSNKKPRYRNKDNPAVELIRKVINNKDVNRPGHYDFT